MDIVKNVFGAVLALIGFVFALSYLGMGHLVMTALPMAILICITVFMISGKPSATKLLKYGLVFGFGYLFVKSGAVEMNNFIWTVLAFVLIYKVGIYFSDKIIEKNNYAIKGRGNYAGKCGSIVSTRRHHDEYLGPEYSYLVQNAFHEEK